MAKLINRSTDMVPTMAKRPRTIGSVAATTPPSTQTRTAKLSGIAMDSINSRSRWFCPLICAYATAMPPARTVTPSRSCTRSLVSVLAYFCASFSPPFRPATIIPDLLSLLIRDAAWGRSGGMVHADDTLSTHGDRFSWSTMSVATRRADSLRTPSGAVTTISIC